MILRDWYFNLTLNVDIKNNYSVYNYYKSLHILSDINPVQKIFALYFLYLFNISVCLPLPFPRLCVCLLSIGPSVCLSAEMSPSFVTRLCSDWMVHPFSIWLTRLSRWQDPFIPAVQQSAPRCNPSPHPKHRCKGAGYFSPCTCPYSAYVHTDKKCTLNTRNCCVFTHMNLWANTRCADAASCCGLLATSRLLMIIIFV